MKTAGYLATYVATYEYNMGMEYAQFPSGTYTNTYRTDVLYYGFSKDGVVWEGLNNHKPVFYPQGRYRLQGPALFRKADETYGLISGLKNQPGKLLLADSKDLIFYTNERIVTIGGIEEDIINPTVVYDEIGSEYCIFGEMQPGFGFTCTTINFKEFTVMKEIEYKKHSISGQFPPYAKEEEASVLPLNQEERDSVVNKYGTFRPILMEQLEPIYTTQDRNITLPEDVEILYLDGSRANYKVDWECPNPEWLIGYPPIGTHRIHGRLRRPEYQSPLVYYRADPYITYHPEDEMYYMTGSNLNEKSAAGGGAYGSIVLRKAKTIGELTHAKEYDIWTMGEIDGVKVFPWYWAPELHLIGGKWSIICLGTVDEGEGGKWRQCIFTCEGADLLDTTAWTYTGYIGKTIDGDEVGAFDTTYFEHKGRGYYVTPKQSCIYITTVDPKNPLVPTGPLVKISSPSLAFEYNIGSGRDFCNNDGQEVQEGPAVLIHEDKVFITYSGSTVDMHYCIGLLYADIDSDFLNPDSWHKYPYPLLNTTDMTTTIKDSVLLDEKGEYKGIFGPGHNSFTVDESGNPLLVYHARDWKHTYEGAIGKEKYGLVDPGRHTYVAPVHFGYDDFPILNLSPWDLIPKEFEEVEITLIVQDNNY